MRSETNNLRDREQLLDEVLASYLKAAESGTAGSRDDWLARYPDLAADLAEFFAGQDEVDGLTAPLRAAAAGSSARSGDASAEDTRGEQDVRAGDAVGFSFGSYDVLSVLAQGGMGVVYKARQHHPSRLVALKMIRTGPLAAPADVQRFRNETEVIAALDHPHIVPIYEVGEFQDCLYFSMKFLEGGALTAQVSRFTGDPRAAAQLLVAVARAVHYVHQRGVLHRDLKPSNILLDSGGRPHVADFGLAKRMQTDSSLTHSGGVVGTPRYMAPEQAAGQKAQITTATDVYGLGTVLYVLLTGKPPFHGDSVLETLEQVRSREPAPPRSSNPIVDRDLETICLKCLEKEPGRRYASAEAVADELERWLHGEPIQARRAAVWERVRKWIKRRPALAALAAVSAAALVALLCGAVWHDAQLRAAAAREHDLAVAADRERSTALSNEAKANALRRQAEVHLDRAFNDMGDLVRELDRKEFAEVPGIDRVRQELAASILRHYESYLDEQSPDPEVRHWTARAYQSVGLIQRDPRKGVEALVKSVTISEALTREFPAEARYWLRLGHNRFVLAAYLVGQRIKPQAAEEFHHAMDAFEAAVRCDPDDYRALNNLAWHLATSDVKTIHDPARAVVFAQRAVALAPDYAAAWHTLGLAYYQVGTWSEAVTALEKALALLAETSKQANETRSMRGDNTTTAMTWLYLAIAYSRLGNAQKARLWFDKAMQWMDKNAAQDGELRRLRAEAAALLGIRQQPSVQNKEASPRRK
jgi:serine/threonine-protein kinase